MKFINIKTVGKVLLVISLIVALVLPLASTMPVLAAPVLKEGYSLGIEVYYDWKIYGDWWAAQTFTTSSSYEITSVRVFAKRVGSPGDITVSIKAVDGNGKPTGADLTTGSTSANGWSTSGAWHEIDVTDYFLLPEVMYAIVVRCLTGTVDNYVWWAANNTPLYDGGKFHWSDTAGPVWQQESSKDYWFQVWGELPATYPSVTTNVPTGITNASATLNANLTDLGSGATDADCWFEWDWVEDDYTKSTTPENKATTGTFNSVVALDVGGRQFKVRAVAENDLGKKAYGITRYFWSAPFPVTVVEDTYVMRGGIVTHVFQRKAWYAASRHWIIYLKSASPSPNGGFYYKSSLDGESWTDPSLYIEAENLLGDTPPLQGMNESDELNVYFDGTFLHAIYVWNRNRADEESNNIYYRRGVPQSDGTIDWTSDWVIAVPRSNTTVKGYATIVCDTDGYPWIDYWESAGLTESNGQPSGQIDRKVVKSSTKDGTFTIAGGYPVTLVTNIGVRGTGALVQLPNNKVYAIVSIYNNLKGRLYNGSSWESEVSIATDADNMYRYSAVTRGEIIYLIYTRHEATPAMPTDIKFTKMLDTGWTTPEIIISDLDHESSYLEPHATMTINGTTGDLYVFWVDYETNYIKYKIYDDGTSIWSSAVNWFNESKHLVVYDEFSTHIGSYLEVYGGKIGVYYVTADPDWTPTTNEIYADLRFGFLEAEAGAFVRTDGVANVEQTSVTLQGTLINGGGEVCSVRFQWGLDITYGNNTVWQGNKETGAVFSEDLIELTPGTTYYYRAQARWADETTSSGDGRIFTTLSTGFPILTTEDATGVSQTGAVLHGELTSLGEYSPVYVSFEYGTTTAYGGNTVDQARVATGDFQASISGLSANTLYHFRARVRYNGSYVYGSDNTLTTPASDTPTITTGIATNISNTYATLQGNLTALGNYTPVYVYFQYGATTSYGVTTSEQSKTITGVFNQMVSGLLPNSTYHFRAVVKYNSSYIYGVDATFTTSEEAVPGEPGIDPPDTFRIDDVKVFTNYLESGDQLYVIAYRIVYMTGTPVLDIGDYFDFQLLDGTILKGQWPVGSWDYKPGSIYLVASSAPAWGGDYRIKIIGTPDKWEVPPEAYRDLTPGDWQGEDLTQLDTWVLSLAESLQSYYTTEMVTYVTGGQSVLSAQGGIVFNMGIPGLSTVRPNLFSARSGYPDIDLETDRDKAREEALKASSEERLGPYITGRLEDTAELLGEDLDMDFREVAGVGLGILYIIFALMIGSVAGNMLWGLSASILVFGPGVYFGVVTPTMISFIAFMSAAIFIYQFWWKTT